MSVLDKKAMKEAEMDARVEQSISEISAAGGSVTKSAVSAITKGANVAISDAYDRVMSRRASAVEPPEQARKLFGQIWGEAMKIARIEDHDKDAALEELAGEVVRLNAEVAVKDAAAEAATTAAEEAITVARAEAEAAVAAAHAQAAADEKATAVLRAERDLFASDKAKLEAEVARLREVLKGAEIALAKSEGKLEAYLSMKPA